MFAPVRDVGAQVGQPFQGGRAVYSDEDAGLPIYRFIFSGRM
jgi:hypothetical protein